MRASPGRVVHYVYENEKDGLLIHRPAIVVAEFEECLELFVFFSSVDYSIDGHRLAQYSLTCQDGTWHWPEREDD